MKTLRLLAAVAFVPAVLALAGPALAQTAPAARTFDFTDVVSSSLTGKAWQAHESKDTAAVLAYTGKCRELYQEQALRQQAALSAPVPTEQPELVRAQWALNDVGTCLFILGQSLEQDGKTIDAIAAYKLLVEKFPYAQCWDNKGWFWKPAEAAKSRIQALEFDAPQM